MDLFLINGHDGISLPEMIDWDIKLSNPEISEEVGVNSLMGLGYELPSLDIEDEPGALWAHSYSANSNSSFELDLLGEGGSAVMVNPSSIMPFVSTQRGIFTEPKSADDDEMSDTKFDAQTLLTVAAEETKIGTSDLKSIDNDFTEDSTEESEDNLENKISVEESTESSFKSESTKKLQEIVHKPIEFISVQALDNSFFEVVSSKKGPSQKRQVLSSLDDVDSIKVYPKPGYSYSCLIAMALKNSKKGSLPVSEIYSFMCHHFPYFKTAPNGWKNSVRHNLSLNKCFEKIEKPPSSGTNGSQRKGCLWAMNPAKISKMDEEVAKWSRKDPVAIKNAMVYPDKLELLERGELKDDAAAFAVGDASEEDSEETKEEEIEEELGVDVEDERISPIDDDSEDEMSRIPPSLQPFEPKFHFNSLVKSRQIIEKVKHVKDEGYGVLEETDTRTLLGFDESTPIYAVDPTNENVLIELPIVKRPRVQGNYFYQPVLNMKRHNGFRSVKIESP